jgi:hypothetical protein
MMSRLHKIAKLANKFVYCKVLPEFETQSNRSIDHRHYENSFSSFVIAAIYIDGKKRRIRDQ